MRARTDPPPPTPPSPRPWARGLGLAGLFALSAAAGRLFESLGTPLPWMIGPLVVTAAVFMTVAPRFSVPTQIRPLGQVVVAMQIGLAFSPEGLDLLARLAPVMVGTALMTGACVMAVAVAVSRLTGQSLAQAFLATVPTSPVEAAAMAMAAGIKPMPVIFAHTLRLSAVVLILPFALSAAAGWPETARAPVSLALPDPPGILLLAAIGVASSAGARFLRVPNPHFLGPLTVAAAIAATGHAPEPFPPLVLAAAQVVLGTWLGATFRRDFIASSFSLTLVSVSAALVLLALCSLGAVAIAAWAGVDWQTMVLGAAPGGVVEMALTAKFLAQNVVLITTFHLVRIFIFMPNIPWIVRLIVRYETRTRAEARPE